MNVRFENITSQVDGITDTFITSKDYISGTLSLGYNGQLYPQGVNIRQEIAPTGVKLTFVPSSDTHSLLLIYLDATDLDPIMVASALPPRSSC